MELEIRYNYNNFYILFMYGKFITDNIHYQDLETRKKNLKKNLIHLQML